MTHRKTRQTWIFGQVNWYDPDSGQGSIISDDGIWYRIHEFSDIQKTLQHSLTEKTRVAFDLVNDSIYPVIKNVRLRGERENEA